MSDMSAYKQDYDTECATMTFGEEEIDWKVMNIKMTIDKTGKQHPSWVYTPLYTKDILTPALQQEPSDDQYSIQPHPVNVVEASEEYETISVSETFDAEEAEWKENEGFRLTFDPTGKRNPQIQLLVVRKVPASQIGDGVDVSDGFSVPIPTVVRPPSPLPDSSPEPLQDSEETVAVEEEITIEVAGTTEETPELSFDTETDIPSEAPVRPATPVSVNGHSEIVQEVVISEEEAEPEKEEIIVKSEAILPRITLKKQVGGSVRIKNQKMFDSMEESTEGTFILPDINKYSKEIGAFIKDELIDIHMQNKLKNNKAINWWVDEIPGCSPLWPLWQHQDGKSFMRAGNFILYGFQDKRIKIRSALDAMLSNANIATVKQRYFYEMCLQQSKLGNSLYTADHLGQRWSSLLSDGWCAYERKALLNPDDATPPDEGCRVQPIHVYMLANVLCRPIVVMTGISDDELSADEELRGIYLPFEHEPEVCVKQPILLGYSHTNAHFAPLVTATTSSKTDNTPITIPVTDSTLEILPVHFAVYPGEEWIPDDTKASTEEITGLSVDETLQELSKYMHVSKVTYNKQGETVNNTTIAAQLSSKETPLKKPEGYEQLLKNYTKGAKARYKSVKKEVRCKTAKCKRMPSSQLDGVCYKCYYKISSSPNIAQ